MFTRFSVRAVPAAGHNFRRRAGRSWSTTPVEVDLVEKVTDPDSQITHAQLLELQGDQRIAVVPVGESGDGPTAEDVSKLVVELEERGREIERLNGIITTLSAENAELRRNIAPVAAPPAPAPVAPSAPADPAPDAPSVPATPEGDKPRRGRASQGQ